MAFQKTNSALLFVGDLLILVLSLWVSLWLRYLDVPSEKLFLLHLLPFSYIFAVWILIYFIYDLYRRQISFTSQRTLSTLLNAHILGSVVAILFFYLIPYFGITPKTNLFIFLVISFILMAFWRVYLTRFISRGKKEMIVFACNGPEITELFEAFQNGDRHNIGKCEIVEDVNEIKIKYPQASLVAINTYGRDTASLFDFYSMLFSGTRFVKVESLYEDLFGRVPLSLISERWFLEHVSIHPKPVYDLLKRVVDIVVALVGGIISLVFYPFVSLFIKLDDGGPVFFPQARVGKGGKVFNIYKFRTMKDGQVTRVGKFLRASRLDEVVQLWSVVKGDMSLVGPRPEMPTYVEGYRQEIPYYDIRHLIAPGLSGWAQIYHENHPHFVPQTERTKEKLSYDLYYIKNRNLILDLTIILKTIRILLLRRGI